MEKAKRLGMNRDTWFSWTRRSGQKRQPFLVWHGVWNKRVCKVLSEMHLIEDPAAWISIQSIKICTPMVLPLTSGLPKTVNKQLWMFWSLQTIFQNWLTQFPCWNQIKHSPVLHVWISRMYTTVMKVWISKASSLWKNSNCTGAKSHKQSIIILGEWRK